MSFILTAIILFLLFKWVYYKWEQEDRDNLHRLRMERQEADRCKRELDLSNENELLRSELTKIKNKYGLNTDEEKEKSNPEINSSDNQKNNYGIGLTLPVKAESFDDYEASEYDEYDELANAEWDYDPNNPAHDPDQNPWIDVYGPGDEAETAYWNTD